MHSTDKMSAHATGRHVSGAMRSVFPPDRIEPISPAPVGIVRFGMRIASPQHDAAGGEIAEGAQADHQPTASDHLDLVDGG